MQGNKPSNQADKKKPKETDAIKAKLENYAAFQRRIDNQIERLERLNASMGSPSTPKLTGLPSGGGDGSSKVERQVVRRLELQEKIRDMIEEEQQERRELETLIDSLTKPDEQTVIQMRYLDGEEWRAVCDALYSTKDDYKKNSGKYLKRTFKLHGSALQSLARIYNTCPVKQPGEG